MENEIINKMEDLNLQERTSIISNIFLSLINIFIYII